MSAHPADRAPDGLVVHAECSWGGGVALYRRGPGGVAGPADVFDRVAVGVFEELGEQGARLFGGGLYSVVAGHGWCASGEGSIAELLARGPR